MRDREIVAAVVAGDPAGLAGAYDNYAAMLHGYCRSLLAEPADAADAVQDTFVIAAAKLGELRDPDRLRPWLYAVARNECHRRLRARARFASLEEAGDVTDAADAEPFAAADQAMLRELVIAAVAGLNPGDRELIELNLRHALDGSDLADALGVPLNQAHALASRARGQLERSLGALLVARTGRRSCAELDAILGDWDGRMTILLRKRVSRHIDNCEICVERRRRELSPAMLLSVLPLVTLPAGLRQQVLRLVSDRSPDAVRYRAAIVRRAGKFRESGFPVQLSPVGASRKLRPGPHTAVYAAAAALIIVAGGGGTSAYLLSHRHDVAARGSVAATLTITVTPSATATLAATAPSPTTPAGSAATNRPPATASTSTTPSPSSTPSGSPPASPSPGTLQVSSTLIRLPEPAPDAGAFALTAVGGPVRYAITVPSAEQSYLTLTPAGGTLAAGQHVQVTVTVTPVPGSSPPAYFNTAAVNPGSVTITIYYEPSG